MAKGPKSNKGKSNSSEAIWIEHARRRAGSEEFRTRALLQCVDMARKYGPLIDLRDALGLTMDFARAELLKACVPAGVAANHRTVQEVAMAAAVNVITAHPALCACASGIGRAAVSVPELDTFVLRFMTWWSQECIQAASAAVTGRMTERQRRIREIRAPLVEETTPTLSELSATLKAGYQAHRQAARMKHESQADAVPFVASVMWTLLDKPKRLARAIYRTPEGKVNFDALRLRDLMGDRKRTGEARDVASDEDTIESAAVPKQPEAVSEVLAAVQASESVGAARKIRALLAERAAACAPGGLEQVVLIHFHLLADGSLSTRALARRTGLPRTTIQSVFEKEKKKLRDDPRFREFARHVG